jgi:hypothetical protein
MVVVGEQKRCCCPFYCCESIQSVSQVDPLQRSYKNNLFTVLFALVVQ